MRKFGCAIAVLGLILVMAGVVHAGDTDIVDRGALGYVYDGSQWRKLQGNTEGNMKVVTQEDSIVTANLVSKSVDFTSSQTDQTIWTPATGKKFVITNIFTSFLSTESTCDGLITVFDGTNTAGNIIIKSRPSTPGSVSYVKPRVSAAANNILKYTTSGTATVGSIIVEGYEI